MTTPDQRKKWSESRRKYAAEHRAATLARYRKYYRDNRVRLNERARLYQRTPKGRATHYATADVRRARMRGATSERIIRAIVYERCKYRCGICRKRVAKGDESLDHIVPLAHGGAHVYANVQLAHKVCNARKRATYQPNLFTD